MRRAYFCSDSNRDLFCDFKTLACVTILRVFLMPTLKLHLIRASSFTHVQKQNDHILKGRFFLNNLCALWESSNQTTQKDMFLRTSVIIIRIMRLIRYLVANAQRGKKQNSALKPLRCFSLGDASCAWAGCWRTRVEAAHLKARLLVIPLWNA